MRANSDLSGFDGFKRSTKHVSRVSVWYDRIFTDLSIGVKAKCQPVHGIEDVAQQPRSQGLSGEKNLEKRQPLKTFSLVERNEQKALLNITQSEQRDFS